MKRLNAYRKKVLSTVGRVTCLIAAQRGNSFRVTLFSTDAVCPGLVFGRISPSRLRKAVKYGCENFSLGEAQE